MPFYFLSVQPVYSFVSNYMALHAILFPFCTTSIQFRKQLCSSHHAFFGYELSKTMQVTSNFMTLFIERLLIIIICKLVLYLLSTLYVIMCLLFLSCDTAD
jgi:hypothetical protein